MLSIQNKSNKEINFVINNARQLGVLCEQDDIYSYIRPKNDESMIVHVKIYESLYSKNIHIGEELWSGYLPLELDTLFEFDGRFVFMNKLKMPQSSYHLDDKKECNDTRNYNWILFVLFVLFLLFIIGLVKYKMK